MNLSLQNHVFIVTGGSKGIGKAITQALVDEGAKVMMLTRSRAATEAFAAELAQAGQEAGYFLADLSEAGACEAAVAATLEQFGQINGVVNNAGVNDCVNLEAGPEAFRQSLQTNLIHYYELVHFALPQLKMHQGAIVNISSKVALTGQGGTSGYAAAKGAQLALTREWAAELAPHGIRVNAVLPAEVMTPLYRKWLDTSFDDPDAQERLIGERIPLGKRMTTAEEIAAMTVFLLSERSAHTTGQWLVVDGGYVHLDRALAY